MEDIARLGHWKGGDADAGTTLGKKEAFGNLCPRLSGSLGPALDMTSSS